ncbi:MAG: cytochrome oxidase putative small subunit CydP [Pseudomonadota bacterium]
MTLADRKLLHEIVVVVVLKLAVLVVLWNAFVRNERVSVDAARVASQVSAVSSPSPSASATTGDRHGQ